MRIYLRGDTDGRHRIGVAVRSKSGKRGVNQIQPAIRVLLGCAGLWPLHGMQGADIDRAAHQFDRPSRL
jgi:hypothetical protein